MLEPGVDLAEWLGCQAIPALAACLRLLDQRRRAENTQMLADGRAAHSGKRVGRGHRRAAAPAPVTRPGWRVGWDRPGRRRLWMVCSA